MLRCRPSSDQCLSKGSWPSGKAHCLSATGTCLTPMLLAEMPTFLGISQFSAVAPASTVGFEDFCCSVASEDGTSLHTDRDITGPHRGCPINQALPRRPQASPRPSPNQFLHVFLRLLRALSGRSLRRCPACPGPPCGWRELEGKSNASVQVRMKHMPPATLSRSWLRKPRQWPVEVQDHLTRAVQTSNCIMGRARSVFQTISAVMGFGCGVGAQHAF